MPKFKRIGALVVALVLSLSLCCTAAFAAPIFGGSDTDSESQTEVVDESGMAVNDAEAAEEDNGPFGPSYIIKGLVVVGVGVAFYIGVSIKSRKK